MRTIDTQMLHVDEMMNIRRNVRLIRSKKEETTATALFIIETNWKALTVNGRNIWSAQWIEYTNAYISSLPFSSANVGKTTSDGIWRWSCLRQSIFKGFTSMIPCKRHHQQHLSQTLTWHFLFYILWLRFIKSKRKSTRNLSVFFDSIDSCYHFIFNNFICCFLSLSFSVSH